MNLRPSALVLIGANFVPLIGVFLWDWSVFEIVLLYWAENVFVGLINVLKMIAASPDMSKMKGLLTGAVDKLSERAKSEADRETVEAIDFYAEKFEGNASSIGTVHHVSKAFFVPFFCVHYGVFCLVHGVFVMALLSDGGGLRGGGGFTGAPVGALFGQVFNGPVFLSALVLGGSHVFSFFANFLGKGEFRKTTLPQLMMQPYGRIVVLHIAILGGAFAVALLGDPVYLLVVLIGGKIVLDVKMHLRERAKIAALPDRGETPVT